ncbi:hypothetical protein P3T92_13945 (plasmid) [Staphylococcus aureus]|uniref:hypothetical protein n=1 Tax=Staphylococcus aureus TaxID=1280 RepID=UPI002B25F630|nr:hypothetical protein [Staphylococcus aureus]WQL24270.1 hypothetical protein P3T92_13945 [Staphylococcus aureus]
MRKKKKKQVTGNVGQDGQWEVDVPAGEELKPGGQSYSKRNRFHQALNHQVGTGKRS